MTRLAFCKSSPNAGLSAVALVVIIGAAVALLLGVIAFFIGIGKYNRIQTLDESVDAAWAQVETVLQRRYDLIPNLVNTVKGFAEQEREVLTEVTRLRSQWGEARTTSEQAQAATQLESALGRLMVVVERYPELKSNQNFLALQSQLEGTENRISVERRRYNETLRDYNAYVRMFPNNLIADPRDDYFQAAGGAETAPTVEF